MTDQVSKILSKYVNLKNALSVALTITLTAFINSLGQNEDEIGKYMIVLTFLFILWVCVFIVEKGGISFVSWIAQFFEKKQDNAQEVRLARLQFSTSLHPPTVTTENTQHPVINGTVKVTELESQPGYQTVIR